MSSSSIISSVTTNSQKYQDDCSEKSNNKGPLIIELENGVVIGKRRIPRAWYQIPEIRMYFCILILIVIISIVLFWRMVQRNLEKSKEIEMRHEKPPANLSKF